MRSGKSQNSMITQWQARAGRIEARTRLRAADLGRSVSWHLGGGRRFFERYAPELLAAHRWCFIVACNNSGTSLLQSMLERTGQISTMLFEGQRYTKLLTRATHPGHERVWTENLDELRLTREDPLACVPRLLHDWMGALAPPVQRIIVEKTTANAMRMTWLQEAFPDSLFIAVVRNGYAVTEGIYRKGEKSIQRGAKHWNLANRIMMEDSEKVRNFLELRYEDLVENSSDTARRLAEFMGLDPQVLIRAMQEEYGFATIRGDVSQHVVNLNEDSIARLKVEDIQTISLEAREMLDYFGYRAPQRA